MILAVVKAIITRAVFATHGFVAIWQVTTFKKNPLFWYLSCPIILLFFEGIFTLAIKENQEWKWFCPSVFLYLCSVVPGIWLLELDKVSRRLRRLESNINITDNFDFKNIAAEDLKHLEKALGVNFYLPDIQISTETWITLIEQFLMLILIVGRWMLPKGDLTRDQLSQLLLVYIGTAADIIEFFDSFKDEKIAREPMLVYLTLGIWTWSLIQFTVVLTATKSRKSRLSSANAVKRKAAKTSCCSIDVWGIALNMILQDGPFLAFRLILIVQYKIVNYMNVFFTCKNTLVILLQLYRLFVVQSENRNKLKRKKCSYEREEMATISVISRGDVFRGTQLPKRHFSDERKKKTKKHEDVLSEDDSSEELDGYDSELVKKNTRSKKNRQDTGYSTSSSRNSAKPSKSSKKASREPSTKKFPKCNVFSEDEKRKKHPQKNCPGKSGKPGTVSKNRIEKYEKNIDRIVRKNENRKNTDESTEGNLDSEESGVTDSEEKEKVRQKYRRKRRNGD